MAGRNTVEIILSAKDQASEQVKKAFESISESHSKMGTMLAVGAGAAAAGLGALGAYIAKTGVDYDTMIENSTIAWTTLLGSQAKAKDMIQQISTFAKNTQFGTEQVDAMAKYFNNAGYAGKNLFDELQRIADVSGAFNITADAAQELARQMSQVDQAGVAYTSDLDILQNQGIPIFKAIAKEVGTNVAAVRKMASNGQITADIYNKAFNSIANTVKGASNAQSQTFTGMISTLQDDFGIISGILAKPVFNVLHEGLQKLLPLLDGLTSLARGDFKSFQTSLNQTFGPQAGNIIGVFSKSIMQGVGMIKQYLNQGKQVLAAFFQFASGNDIGGMSILKRLGLGTDQIVMVTKTFDGIKQATSNFLKTLSGLFKGSNSIQNSFVSIFNTAYKIIKPILMDIVAFCQKQFAQIKVFWDQNGAQIIAAVKNFVAIVAAIFKAFAPAIETILKTAWSNIKTIISGAIGIIEGILKVFAGVFTGDWAKVWEGVKQILSSAWGTIKGVIGNDFGMLPTLFENIWSGVVRIFNLDGAVANIRSGINQIKSFFANLVTHIPMPHFDITMGSTDIAGVKVPTPNIGVKWYDTGGVFYGPQVIGVGEKRPEFVGALDDLRKIFREEGGNVNSQLINAMNQTQRQTADGQPIVLNIDGRTMARVLKPYMDNENKRVGPIMKLQTIN